MVSPSDAAEQLVGLELRLVLSTLGALPDTVIAVAAVAPLAGCIAQVQN
jgi:hypothetical protein